MKALLCLFMSVFICASVYADQSTNGYRKIVRLYLNGPDYVNIYLDETCTQGKSYFMLKPSRVDVDRFYSTMMAAFFAGKKVNVRWEPNGSFCEVTRIFVE